jgi:hypothetical protein
LHDVDRLISATTAFGFLAGCASDYGSMGDRDLCASLANWHCRQAACLLPRSAMEKVWVQIDPRRLVDPAGPAASCLIEITDGRTAAAIAAISSTRGKDSPW